MAAQRRSVAPVFQRKPQPHSADADQRSRDGLRPGRDRLQSPPSERCEHRGFSRVVQLRSDHAACLTLSNNNRAAVDVRGVMADRTDGDLLAFFDSARPNARYWATIVLLCIASGVEFFDFYIVGFLVAVIGLLWHLTYGQSAIMLLSAGLGAIAGSLIWGALADVFGRKSLIV